MNFKRSTHWLKLAGCRFLCALGTNAKRKRLLSPASVRIISAISVYLCFFFFSSSVGLFRPPPTRTGCNGLAPRKVGRFAIFDFVVFFLKGDERGGKGRYFTG